MGRFNTTVTNAKFINKLHRYFYIGWVLFFFLLAFPLLWYYKKDKDRYYSQLVRLRRWIAYNSASFAGFKFEIESETNIDWSKNYVICANHTSNLDITTLMISCKTDCSFIGKVELLDNPVTALFFKTIDIPVDRKSKLSSFRAFKKALSLLQSGKSIAIFPEGGIYDDYPPQLNPFKIGAFKLAMDGNVPILPIVIHNAWELCWDDGSVYGTSPGLCNITVLKPVDPKGFSNAEEFMKEVYDKYQKNWKPETVTI